MAIKQNSNRYISYYNHPVIVCMRKNNLTANDVCRMLNVTKATFKRYIEKPELITLHTLMIFSSMCNISMYEMLYKLTHNTRVSTEEMTNHIKEGEISFDLSK